MDQHHHGIGPLRLELGHFGVDGVRLVGKGEIGNA
jgi:hypothetical protein